MKNLILIITAILIVNTLSFAQQSNENKTLSPYFFVQSNTGEIDQLPLKSTSAKVNIAGIIADVAITQVYENKGKSTLEAIYVFPGSTRAAVYGMEMKIGDRTIVANIREKNQARREYHEAKSQGKRVSLLEQKRPNVFQMQVANIMPNDRIEVTLKYTEMLIPTESVYEFVYPTVVGPRYSEAKKGEDSNNDFASTPYLKKGEKIPYDFNIQISVNAGMPIQNIVSCTHKINLSYPDLHTAVLHLDAAEKTGGNRDFILQYQLAGRKIAAGLLLYEGEKENFFTLVVQPPKTVELDHIPPREYIFIVDVSGSMNGFPIQVTKKLLRNLISNLRPTDRFNVLLFASTSYMMAEESVHATSENIRDAFDVLDNQRGSGGTRIFSAMQKALQLPRCEIGLSRSLVVVTDGFITVEEKVFDLISDNLNQANLFAFGIGSGVNRHLIEGMAHVGQGEPFIITSLAEANEKAEKFRKYISSPVLTQIKVDFGDFKTYDVEPVSVPDVLAERPIVIYGKWEGKPTGNIKLSGYSGNGPYYANFNVDDVLPNTKNQALKYLWARESIKRLGDYQSVSRDQTLKEEITNLGLKYNLMTAYTSFIAIDHETNKINNRKTVKQPLPLPENVNNTAVGFDLAIEGVLRKSKRVSKMRVKFSTKHSHLPLALQEGIKTKLQSQAKNIQAFLTKNGWQSLELELFFTDNGEIVAVSIKNVGFKQSLVANLEKFLVGLKVDDALFGKEAMVELVLEFGK